uniref:Uncharacterized protein n=1 Tax=Anguilla anguilla TaxID=7936 RepID=A0A0E9SLY2_ANGAN
MSQPMGCCLGKLDAIRVSLQCSISKLYKNLFYVHTEL